jgi:hypothetical protein
MGGDDIDLRAVGLIVEIIGGVEDNSSPPLAQR